MAKGNSFQVDTTTEAYRVAKQIERVNEAFSGFDASPDAVNSIAEMYDYVSMAHRGKKVALSVMTLEAMVAGKLKKMGFYDSELIQKSKNVAFNKITIVTGNRNGFNGHTLTDSIYTYKYLSKNPVLQMEGLMDIAEYYALLYDAIISMKEFSNAIFVSSNKDVDDEIVDDQTGSSD